MPGFTFILLIVDKHDTAFVRDFIGMFFNLLRSCHEFDVDSTPNILHRFPKTELLNASGKKPFFNSVNPNVFVKFSRGMFRNDRESDSIKERCFSGFLQFMMARPLKRGRKKRRSPRKGGGFKNVDWLMLKIGKGIAKGLGLKGKRY